MSGPPYDVVVFGAGSGGYSCALRSAQLGLKVALVESGKVGGTCLHRGCIPTMALLQSAEVADTCQDAGSWGINAELGGVDMAKVSKFQQGIIDRMHKGLIGLINGSGIELVEGQGRLTSPYTVDVAGRQIEGRHVVLATGSAARSLPDVTIEGRVITSDQALFLDWVPQSALVIGGGVIGLEFASIWRSFGASVTIVETETRLAPGFDETISKALQRSLKRRGIKFKLGAQVTHVSQTESKAEITLSDEVKLQADAVLIAISRGPFTAGLGFEENGVRLDRGLVVTDQQLHTGVENLWAVGDIVPGPQLAHRAYAHGVAVAERIAGLKTPPLVEQNLPLAIHGDPEVVAVGLTEAAAVASFGQEAIEIQEYNLAGNARSQALKTHGLVKVIRQVNGPVIGMHLIGRRIGELAGQAQLIVNWQAHPEEVAELIQAHPTQDEAIGEAFMALAGKPLHAHP
ncbi:MAG: dihydrolipoyl dehydrogenase [Micrococcales bacterium]|nr:dihydrolipoyl dehydrogenase [Micrococcales bacterium]